MPIITIQQQHLSKKLFRMQRNGLTRKVLQATEKVGVLIPLSRSVSYLVHGKRILDFQNIIAAPSFAALKHLQKQGAIREEKDADASAHEDADAHEDASAVASKSILLSMGSTPHPLW